MTLRLAILIHYPASQISVTWPHSLVSWRRHSLGKCWHVSRTLEQPVITFIQKPDVYRASYYTNSFSGCFISIPCAFPSSLVLHEFLDMLNNYLHGTPLLFYSYCVEDFWTWVHRISLDEINQWVGNHLYSIFTTQLFLESLGTVHMLRYLKIGNLTPPPPP